MDKVIQRRIIYIIYSILFLLVSSLLFTNNVFADSSLNYSVSVEPALNITTSASKVSLNLNPLTHDFDSQDLKVSVSTNNETGYKLYVNTSTTDLVEKNDSNLTIKTLDSETPENDFTVNKWGYKINTENYLPFKSGTLLNYKYTAIENDSTNLTFAAKINYGTKAGSYSLPLIFQATALNVRYMQNFTVDDCKNLASSASYTVYDLRDENDYQVRYINGNCWMVQNLRFTGAELSSSTSNVEDKYTDASPYRINNGSGWADLTKGNSYDEARLHDSGNTTNGVWYNYAGGSAGTVTGSSNNYGTSIYDICPKNWKIPTREQFSSIADYKSMFAPATGGVWGNGGAGWVEQGYWLSADAYNTTHCYRLAFHYGILDPNSYDSRFTGESIRCIRSN